MSSSRLLGPALCAVVAACTAGKSGARANEGTGAGGAGTGGNGSGGMPLGVGGGVGGASDACSDESKLVYVVGAQNEFSSYLPPTTFTPVGSGTLSCPNANGATPFSMAIDRTGRAWVLFTDGRIFNVSTHDAACTESPFVANQGNGFDRFGMGFVSDTPGASAETLYLASYDGVGLGKLPLDTLGVGLVGSYDALFTSAEMTGTGDARAFGFFLTTPPTVAEIDKSNGHILSQAPQPTVNIGSAWAFAFWGGDFYLFTSPSGFSSQVDRYRPANNTTTTVVPSVGFSIIGAGVSTCAPVTPPN